MSKPRFGLLDPRFKYVPACATNIRETFKRFREQQKPAAVVPLKKGKG